MGVGLQIGRVISEIGTSDFFHSIFSTISSNLEPKGWGTRFPILMNKLYAGKLCQFDADGALREIDEVTSELAELNIEKVVWDIGDKSKEPPWGSNVAETVTDLSNYFVTSTGRDLVNMVREILEESRDGGGDVQVVSF